MNITDHAFENSDAQYEQIKQLLLEIETHPEIDNNWDPGRMDWWRYNYHADKPVDFFRSNARFWRTATDRVVGLFISEYGRDDFFLVTHPDADQCFGEILNWVTMDWARDRERISTSVFTYGKQKIERLLAAGFYEDGHEENVRTYAMDQYDFNYRLPRGYELRSFNEYGDYARRVQLVQNAFKNPSYNEARLRSLQDSPNYKDELDLVVLNGQQQSVGYCMGWIEEINPRSGYIEPMGVHTDHRMRGLGTALAKECFRRLNDLGVESAWVASRAEPDISNYLYDALKPQKIKRSYRYSLDL